MRQANIGGAGVTSRQREDPVAARRRHLDGLVDRARLAAAAATQLSQADCDRITRAMVVRGLEVAQQLAVQAVAETKIGLVEDKAVKNMIATEFVWHAIKDVRSVGVVAEDPERNLKTVAEPVGVVLGVTPVTNPTATVLFKSLMVAKTRNAIVFAPHPYAWRCSNEAARLMAEAGVAAGAPDGFISWVDDIQQDDTRWLMQHPGVALIDATGGPGMVRAAYSSGKPALGVGAGNVPCYVHRTADLRMAVVDVLTSKTFDNGTACASEQTVIVDRAVYDDVLRLFAEMGAHVCTPDEVALLERTVVDPVRGTMQPTAVGQSAVRIAQEIGLAVAPETKLLLAPLAGVGRAHPLSCEKLFPVLGIVPVDGEDDAINAALDVLYFGGVGHTASIFSADQALIDRYAAAVNAGRIIVNSPSSVGALGGVYNDLTPTLSFGCGTGGGNGTIENVTVRHYLNMKSVAARTPAHQWFRAPNQIYFNARALEHLRDLPARNVLIVTSRDLDALGLVQTVREHLPRGVPVHVFDRVEIEPTYRVVADGVAAIRYQQPDHLVAIGGGSVLDAAKAMRLFFQHPELDFRSLATTFLDPRKRVIEYPHGGGPPLALVAVPTTSGTGSEVTPFAVITDDERGRKVPLYDHSLTPDMAVLDPELVRGLPPSVTADTGLDALTHALEAVVSVFASEYTDALAMQAARLVFDFLPRAVRDGADLEARTRLHNAACMAGLAFANAFVGVNHALAHALGARFHLPHGRANAVLLPYVVRYNASLPSKFMPFPNVTAYVAPEKYAAVAAAMNLGGASVAERVDLLVGRIVGLLETCGLPTTIAAAGVPRDAFEAALPELIQAACDDISLRSNPRMPLLHELEGILRRAWDGPAT
jgi:acetaldehyde dehydrogenase/alcohol dehydrogenase